MLNWIVRNKTVCMYKIDLALNIQQWFICHKTKSNQSELNPTSILVVTINHTIVRLEFIRARECVAPLYCHYSHVHFDLYCLYLLRCNLRVKKNWATIYKVLWLLVFWNLTRVRISGQSVRQCPGDLGSIPGRVIPKTIKIVLDTSLLYTQQYKVRIEGKVGQSKERSSALPNASVL